MKSIGYAVVWIVIIAFVVAMVANGADFTFD